MAAVNSMVGRWSPKPMSLANWPDALREFVASTDAYAQWCKPPAPLPPPPGDPKKRGAWDKEKADWIKANQEFEERKRQGRMKTAEFAQWLQQEAKSPEQRKAVAPLIAMCTAVEKLPAVEASKRETVELLESMADADLKITGSLVVWDASDPRKQCVLATFTAGKDPVVVKHEDSAAKAIPAPDVSTP